MTQQLELLAPAGTPQILKSVILAGADAAYIGGSRFGNYEGLLPDQKGRVWFECDIDFDGTYRGAKRIVFSNDGLIYYTEDHYKSFEKLY